MEIKIRWLTTAVEDVNNICDYLAQKNPVATDKLYDAFLDTVDELLIFPEAGQLEPLLNDYEGGFRYLVVNNHYKLIYTIKETTVEIAVVWDCRRDPSLLSQRINK